MQDASLGSVSIWLEGLIAGDERAAEQLWNRYFLRLTALARSRLQNLTRVVDEEDVALSVLKNVFATAQRGGYPHLTDRTELWPLLVSITLRKTSNALKWHFTQKRTPQSEEHLAELAELADKNLGPEMIVQIADQLQHLMHALHDDTLEQMAQQRLAGHTVADIAKHHGVSRQTVDRKLARIRQEWEAVSSR